MLTADLKDGEIAVFAPFEGARVRGATQGKRYDMFIRHPGQTGWHFGVTCENAAMAWSCQNYVMRTYDSRVQVKMLAK